MREFEIKLSDFLLAARKDMITFQKIDIVFVRTGFLKKKWDTTLTVKAIKSYAENPASMQHEGIEATKKMLR